MKIAALLLMLATSRVAFMWDAPDFDSMGVDTVFAWTPTYHYDRTGEYLVSEWRVVRVIVREPLPFPGWSAHVTQYREEP